MHKPQKTEQEQLDFFQRSYEKFLQAKASAGEVNYFYRIGKTSVCLKFAGNALVQYLTPALEHLRVPEGGSPDLTLCLWDSDSTGTAMVPPPLQPGLLYRPGRHMGIPKQPLQDRLSLE